MTRGSVWLGARSNLASIEFPPVLVGPNGTLAALVRQLEDTQWLAPEALEKAQLAQLRVLARHAAQFSPHFRKRLANAKLTPDQLTSLAALRRLPVLRRRELQSGEVVCSEVPPAHQPVGESKTSGSTGEPIAAKRTAINQLMWLAMTMREHLWQRTDFATGLCAIRANIFEVARDADWGPPASLLFRTGRALRLPITLSVEQLTKHLTDFKPGHLIIYPNTMAAIAEHMEQQGIKLGGLQSIRTVGETVSAELRKTAERVFAVPVIDSYSSQELGYVALQCPASGLYHVMGESLIVEILGEDGTPCEVGQVGRVVATDLHNFATPLVRYDIGDYAEVAAPCACGRGLATLKRIVGRERNLIVMPDGSRHWPLVGFHRFRDVAPVAQYQLVQQTREDIEVRLVVDTPLSEKQQSDLGQVILEALGPFKLRFVYFDGALPRGPNGKFDEFVCNVSPGLK